MKVGFTLGQDNPTLLSELGRFIPLFIAKENYNFTLKINLKYQPILLILFAF
ncbi:hypothetical protein THF1A12_320106 [Vibrio jasicida]|uniref:Uncharacterized protein n=1 Tax=Vibrio jasicida TaxID=766224 RepID=A0AAU9QPK0_9VIBR|nr:hypothetical protein THF1A12_320106 [Vibrio jasicida]